MRQFGKILLRRWDDPEWVSLSVGAQWLYDALCSSAKNSAVGVLEWRPKQFAKLNSTADVVFVELAMTELREKLFVILDEDVDLVLIRSFVRNDDVVNNPNMMVAVVKAWRQIGSIDLKQIVVHELLRLREDNPTATIWAHDAMIQTLKTKPWAAVDYVSEKWPAYPGPVDAEIRF